MPSVSIAPQANFYWTDANGAPLALGKVYTYLATTSTPQDTYTSYTGGAANTNPVILDASGRANIWLEQGVSYKFIIKDADDVTLATVDGINYSGGSGLTISLANGSVASPSLYFTNSTGTGLYRIGADDLGIATAGALAVDIDASQNVGIGVSPPTAKLDVNGTTKLRGATTITTGGLTVTAGGATVTAGGITVSAGGATIAGNTAVSGGTFTTRGFVDNATAAAFNLDSSGRLLNNGSTQPAFAAYRATSTQQSGTTLIFNTEQFDTGSAYNNSTGVFTAPVAGVYCFSVSVQLINTTGGAAAGQLLIQGSNAGNVASSSFAYATGTTFSVSTSVVVKLAASETVSAILNTSLTSTFVLDTQAYSRFSGALLY